MSASVTRSDQVLTVRERDRFRREIAERERMLQGHVVIPHVNGAGPEGMDPRRMGRWESFINRDVREDPALIRGQIRKMKRVLDKGSPRNLSRKEKRMLEKEVMADQAYFKRQMVPANIYYQPSMIGPEGNRVPNPRFAGATHAVLENEVTNLEFQKRAARYKNNMRELDPDNPNASNLEKLRPKK